MAEAQKFDVVVVGAGFAGVYMIYKLREAGLKAVVLEAGSDVGGTWYWNRYPGARCDVHSMEYCYSFSKELQQEWTWRERFPKQEEILRYIQHVADRFDLRRDIRFNTRVTAEHFDAERARWTVTTDKGDRYEAQFVVMATGCLSTARIPDIAGLDSFKGAVYHTGRWPHDPVDFKGKRVGVVGTGSSGIQVIPCIAEEADHLTVFQRTPHYSLPAGNFRFSDDYIADWKANYPERSAHARTTRVGVLHEYSDALALETSEEERRKELERRWAKGGNNFMYAYNDTLTKPEANKIVADFVREKIAELVKDPATAAKLMPKDFPIGTKRVCIDTNYYATYNRDNVDLVDLRAEPIEEIIAEGIRTSAATYPLDILVFATGFDAITGTLLSIDIRTSTGRTLRDAWAEGPKTYLGLAVAGLPNLFVITGPISPSVFSNVVLSIEHDVAWITECVSRLRERGVDTIEATPDAQDAWVAHAAELAAGTLFDQADSWYIGANIPGKPRVFMPYLGGVDVYQTKCRDVAENGYRGFTLGASA